MAYPSLEGDGLLPPSIIRGGGSGGSVTVRKNTGADVGTRPRLNLIEGTNITLTVADDAGSNEIDITIDASGASGASAADAFVTIGHPADMTSERNLAVGSGLSLVDGGANSDVTLDRAALTGDVTASAGSNATTIANDAVTYAKMQNVSAISKLLGRGAAAGAGDVEEITLGTNLSMSATTLNATGGGDSITVNGSAVTDADFDDATPAAPSGDLNVKWQKDASSPANVSAYVDVSVLEPLEAVKNHGDQIWAKLTSDFIPGSGTTQVNVTGMSFEVTSGLYYHFTFIVVFQSDTLTGGIGIGLTYPSTTIFSAQLQSCMIATQGVMASTKSEATPYIGPSGTKITTTAVAVQNQDYICVFEGIIVPSANGTVQLQGSEELSSSAVKFRQGTRLKVDIY